MKIAASLVAGRILPQQIYLLIAQLAAHVGLIATVIYGSASEWAVVFGIYFFNGALGMSMIYHRCLAHASWRPPRVLKLVGLFCGTVSLTGSALAWTAIHIEHHHNSDTENDPHAPSIKGFFWVECLSMFRRPRLRIMYRLSADRDLVWFHRHYWSIQAAWVAVLLATGGVWVVLVCYLAPAALVWHGGSLINSLGHMIGATRPDTGDRSRNNFVLAILMWGEGWHANHHRFPKRSYFGERWYQFDVGGFMIKIIDRLRRPARTAFQNETPMVLSKYENSEDRISARS